MEPARKVVHYHRTGDQWRVDDITSGSATLVGLELDLPLDDLFAKLEHVPDA